MNSSPAAGSEDNPPPGGKSVPGENVRTFIAVPVELTPPLREVLQSLTGLGRAVRAVRPHGAHLTLRFLGDTPVATLPDVRRALREAVEGCSGFRMQFRGIGAFPNANRPSVVWAGIEEAGPLEELVNRLEPRLAGLGFPADRLPFSPHLTLARIRNRPPQNVFDLLQQHSATGYGSVEASEVILYQSVLLPDGPQYTALETVELPPEG